MDTDAIHWSRSSFRFYLHSRVYSVLYSLITRVGPCILNQDTEDPNEDVSCCPSIPTPTSLLPPTCLSVTPGNH